MWFSNTSGDWHTMKLEKYCARIFSEASTLVLPEKMLEIQELGPQVKGKNSTFLEYI